MTATASETEDTRPLKSRQSGRNRKARIFSGIVLALLVFCLGTPIFLVYREYRQEELDKALIEAVLNEDVSAARGLLKAGANVHAQQRHVAEPPEAVPDLRTLFIERWKRLFFPQKQADTETYDTPITLLFRMNEKDDRLEALENPAMLKCLLDSGADANAKDQAGNYLLFQSVYFRQYAYTRLLLEHGAHPDMPNYQRGWHEYHAVTLGTTPLMYADQESAELLLAHGADVNARGGWGQTALAVAEPGMIAFLLHHGAQIDAQNNAGETPLMEQVMRQQPESVELLLHYGANRAIRDKAGHTALDHALQSVRNGQLYNGNNIDLKVILDLLKHAGERK